MSIENQNNEYYDNAALRRIVTGDDPATPQQIADLVALADTALEGAPTAVIGECFYATDFGGLTLQTSSGDNPGSEKSGVVIAIHAEDPEDIRFEVGYDSEGRQRHINIFDPQNTEQAINIISALINTNRYGFHEDEVTVFLSLLINLRAVGGKDGLDLDDNFAASGVLLSGLVSGIVKRRVRSQTRVTEVSHRLKDTREICIIGCELVLVDGAPFEFESQDHIPILQINLEDRKNDTLSYFLEFKTGHCAGDTTELSKADDAMNEDCFVEDELEDPNADKSDPTNDIIGDSLSGIKSSTIEALTAAVASILLDPEFKL